MAKHSQERREFTRVPFSTTTTIKTKDRTIQSGSSMDVSMTGLRIKTAESIPPPGTACEVKIVLSNSDPPIIIKAEGAVVRSDKGTLAVNITEIDLDSYQHLRRLILNNASNTEQAEQEIAAHWGIRRDRRGGS